MKKISTPSFYLRAFWIVFVFGKICLLYTNSFAQSDWKWLNPKPSGYANNKIIFVNHNTGFILNSEGDLYKTTNTGTEWQQSGHFPNAVCLDIKDSTGIIAGSFGTVHLSTDNGNSWTQIFPGFNGYFGTVNIVSRDTIFLSNANSNNNSPGTIYKSTDRGVTWTSLPCNIPIRSISFPDSKTGYVGGSGGTISKTVDGGVTWNLKRQVNIIPSTILGMQFISKDTGFALQERDSLLRTYDGGNTWQGGDANFNMPAIDFVNSSDGYLGGEDGAIFATHDGGKTFTSIGIDGLRDGNTIYSIDFISIDTGFAVGLKGRILKTTNAGATWSTYSPTYLPITAISFGSDSTAYATSWNDVYKTSDKGQTWDLLSLKTGIQYASQSRFEKAYFVSPDTGFVTSSDPVRVHHTNDGGNTWDTTSLTPYSFDYVTDMQFIDKKTGFMSILGAISGTTIVKTKDAGLTWDTVWNGGYYGEHFFHISYVDQDTGYAIGYSTLYKTIDGSKNWTRINNINYNSYQLTNVFFVSKHRGFVTDNHGDIYTTNDGGTTWSESFLPQYYSSGINAFKFFNPQVGYLTAGNAFGPVNSGAICKTIDSGTTWTFDKNVGGSSIEFTPDSSVVIAGFAGSILIAEISNLTLPVKLFALSASCQPEGNLVSWKTASETNSNYFEVERSTDGSSFYTVGRVKAKENSSIEMSYVFTDRNATSLPATIVYYRIKSLDLDGSYTYSKIAAVQMPKSDIKFTISPNPATTSTTIFFNKVLSKAVISLFDQQGRKVFADQIKAQSNHYTITTSSYQAGIYTIMVKDQKQSFIGQIAILR